MKAEPVRAKLQYRSGLWSIVQSASEPCEPAASINHRSYFKRFTIIDQDNNGLGVPRPNLIRAKSLIVPRTQDGHLTVANRSQLYRSTTIGTGNM